MENKQKIPGAAIGLYLCGGVMIVLFMMSIVGIAIGGEDGTRPYFVLAAAVTAGMITLCLLSAKWVTEKARERKKKTFASYAFEGEFAPQKKSVIPEKKKPDKH